MDNMDSIFTGKEQIDNLRKSFEKLGVQNPIQEADQTKVQLVAKSTCRFCWGTGNVRLEQELPEKEVLTLASSPSVKRTIKKGLVDKLCGCVKVKKRK